MRNVACIYSITNTADGRRYIGSAKHFGKRKNVHISLLRKGTHHCRFLQSAWNRYGETVFIFEILEIVPNPADLIFREQHYLDLHCATSYNISPIAGNTLGKKHTPEARAKMSTWQRGRMLPPETKKKMAAAQRLRFQNPAERAKIGRKRPITPERRAHISEGVTRRWQSAEEREKQGLRSRGRRVPDAAKAILSAKAKGNKRCVGRVMSPETRAKISASVHRWLAANRTVKDPSV